MVLIYALKNAIKIARMSGHACTTMQLGIGYSV